MTFNEWMYFLAGVFWGGWIIRPIIEIIVKIYNNAKKAHDEQNRKST